MDTNFYNRDYVESLLSSKNITTKSKLNDKINFELNERKTLQKENKVLKSVKGFDWDGALRYHFPLEDTKN